MDRREEDAEIPWPSFVDILSSVIIMFVFFIMITTIIMATLTMETKQSMESTQDAKVQQKVQQIIQEIIQEATQEKDKDKDKEADSEPVLEPKEMLAKLEAMLEQSEQQEREKVEKESFQKDPEQKQNIDQAKADASAVKEENDQLKQDLADLESQVTHLRTALARATEQMVEFGSSKGEMLIFFQRNEVSLSEETITQLRDTIQKKVEENPDVKIELQVGDNPNALTASQGRELGLGRILNIRNVLLENNLESKNVTVKYLPAQEINDSYDWVRLNIIE